MLEREIDRQRQVQRGHISVHGLASYRCVDQEEGRRDAKADGGFGGISLHQDQGCAEENAYEAHNPGDVPEVALAWEGARKDQVQGQPGQAEG